MCARVAPLTRCWQMRLAGPSWVQEVGRGIVSGLTTRAIGWQSTSCPGCPACPACPGCNESWSCGLDVNYLVAFCLFTIGFICGLAIGATGGCFYGLCRRTVKHKQLQNECSDDDFRGRLQAARARARAIQG